MLGRMANEHDNQAPPQVAVVVSRYNASITDRLVEGALDAYALRGGDPGTVHVFHAPGSYELPALAMEVLPNISPGLLLVLLNTFIFPLMVLVTKVFLYVVRYLDLY